MEFLRAPDRRMAASLQLLWQEAFGDAPETTALFYSMLYRPEDACICLIDGELAGMLYLLPVKTGAVSGRYIYAVATARRFQGCGVATQLMEFAHREIEREGGRFAVLVPADLALFTFYRRRGYEVFSASQRRTFLPNEFCCMPGITLDELSLAEFSRLRGRFARSEKAAAVLEWPDSHLRYQLAECGTQRGKAVRVCNQGLSCGYLLCYIDKEKKKTVIKEAYLENIALNAALGALHQCVHTASYEVIFPGILGKDPPFSMIRAIGGALPPVENPYLGLVLD